ncbi:MAG: cyclodeaminase/cyclohydrolase family protein [Oscillospiraceae bacterium]|nr:cyclodeaminase/cyclohydrolase family protein [Oscillospiraceae bacterium]
MDMTLESCRFFVEMLASATPSPGGGGAAALVGAIGTALGHMASNLTVGKKKYADVQQEILALNTKFMLLEKELLDQVEADEHGFLPLAAAYKLPKDAPGYDRFMDEATLEACQVPLKIMELCCQALDQIAFVAEKGTRLAVSDAGSGAVCCKAALQAASLTVFINTKNLKNRSAARAIDEKVNVMLTDYGVLADRIYLDVCRSFGQQGG